MVPTSPGAIEEGVMLNLTGTFPEYTDMLESAVCPVLRTYSLFIDMLSITNE
jgi:hypothetical protein